MESYDDDLLFAGSELNAGFDESDGTWEVIVKYNGDLAAVEDALGVRAEILSENYAIITLDASKMDELAYYPEIEHIEKPKNLIFSLRDSISRACIGIAHSDLSYHLTGKGVVVAIADSGIDYTHPDFRNPDGTSRILFIWDQTGSGKPPQGFSYGIEYNDSDLNKALKHYQPFSVIPEMDYIGHGTAVAGVAAGNGRASGGVNVGAAPEASLIAVRLGRHGERSFVRNTELMRAIKYCIDKAQSLGMPISLNISYGTNNGSHDGNSLFETYIDEMAQKWKTSIIAASGNEGSAGHHYASALGSFESKDVDFYTTDGLRSFYITFWQNFTDEFFLELILPNGRATGEILYSDQDRNIRLGDIAVRAFYGQPSHYNENQEIYFQVEAIKGYLPHGLWRIRIRSEQVVEGAFDIWLPVTEEVTSGTAFTLPDTSTTLTLPSSAQRVVTVGGYDYRYGSLADFSGRGFTRTGGIKPDLVAPSVNILAPKTGGGYDSYTGTSIAAPFVTGAVALMMQWGIVQGNDPFLYGQRVKAFLKSGTQKSPGIEYPSPAWGYGTLCLKNSLDHLAAYLN
ncbi:MAG: S8 family serine peptidase [Clostridiales bacterium]|jgi:subtilisin family serine protease|nr:S8 family serine peptidase [Clostridiales bacterium]